MATKKTGSMKLAQLRQLMENLPIGGIKGKGIEALIVNSEDAHQSEYLRPRDERRAYISGFTGSLGTAIILKNQALLWTDGRYFCQAETELDPPKEWTLMREGVLGTPTQSEWLVANLPPKSTVAADPNLLSYALWAPLHTNLTAAGHCLMPLTENLVDKVWGEDQPAESSNPIVSHPLIYSGVSSGEKIRQCREAMQKNGSTVLVITALDEVAYLLNLRGSDITYNPVFFAYVILTLKEVHLFLDKSRLEPKAEQQLLQEGVHPIFHGYEEVREFLKAKASEASEDLKIWISHHSSYALHADCGEARKHVAITPVRAMKAVKNQVEIQGMLKAHTRDSVALVKYFAWLEKAVKGKKPNDPPLTEISATNRLDKFREEQENYVGASFSTISSVGPHGAIIHYTASEKTDVEITDKEIYLCDSGAQYLDGTTDVTRTMHFGIPTDYQKECFTRVFKGQCHLSTAIFPSMIKGNYLDTLTRKYLWDVGLDYMHGTGHGVGAYLNVHEDPVGISWKPYPDDPGLQPGMFLSNEPGYYEDNKFGIRLENVELVVKANTPHNHRNRGFLTFETVTLVPIQTSFLNVSLLTDKEIEYLNNYHARCLKVLRPFLEGPGDAETLQWLENATRPISR